MLALTPSPKMQFFDANGIPLVGGKLFTYVAGTTTPAATYTDNTGNTPNTNPVIMDSRGECSVWLADALYAFTLKDSLDTLIWTADGIAGPSLLSSINYATDSGIANTYVASITDVPTFVLAAGFAVSVKAATSNTGASTLNVNASGARPIVYPDGTPIEANKIVAGGIFTVVYDGSTYHLQSVNQMFTPKGTNSVLSTVNSKLAQIVSAVDFGADPTGATNSSGRLQNALDYLRLGGGELYLNNGLYKIQSQILIDYTSQTAAPNSQPYQVNIEGEGAGNTVLLSSTGGQYALRVQGTAGIAAHQVTKFSDFSIMNNPAVSASVDGMYLYDIAFTTLTDMAFEGMNVGLTLESVLSSRFENLYFSWNVGAVNLYRGTGFSLANAVEWIGCRFMNSSETAVAGGPVTQMDFNSCNIENNGTQGNLLTGGINLTFDGTEGEVGSGFDGCYFENNAGGWDVDLVNIGPNTITHTFKNCNFQRVSAGRFTVNNVRASNTGGGKQILIFTGCTFNSYNDYVPDANRLYINGDADTTVICIGCFFSSQIEQGPVGNSGIPTDWRDATMQNSWVWYGPNANHPQYMKDAFGFVHLRGAIKGGSVPSIAFTLPVGYRATGEVDFVVNSNAALGILAIGMDGTVHVAVGNTLEISLDGVYFSAT